MNDDTLQEPNISEKGQDVSVESDQSAPQDIVPDPEKPNDGETNVADDQSESFDKKFCHEFVLELSRSLEYFQLQSGEKAPTKFLLDPSFQSQAQLLDCLSQQLSIPSEVLDITKLSGLKTKIDPEHQMLCLSVIGAGSNIDNLPIDTQENSAADTIKTENNNETGS